MKLIVDDKKCLCVGLCVLVAPLLFALDDVGQAVVLVERVSDNVLDEARDAVASCPNGAIILDED